MRKQPPPTFLFHRKTETQRVQPKQFHSLTGVFQIKINRKWFQQRDNSAESTNFEKPECESNQIPNFLNNRTYAKSNHIFIEQSKKNKKGNSFFPHIGY
jgi:hypothetical protein